MSKIALYIRLSVEDQMKKDESESIINQRYFLNDFLDRNDEFKSFKREEYVDDGYTGTNEKRPSFQRMLEEVKSGKINAIIVKDLSRFMRDYISLGDYLENIFPFLVLGLLRLMMAMIVPRKKGTEQTLISSLKVCYMTFIQKIFRRK